MIINKYLKCWENLNPENISELINCLDTKFYFLDPFVELNDKDSFNRHLLKILEKHKKLKFKIIFKIKSVDGYLIKWNFKVENSFVKPFSGISEIKTKEGLIISHIDYWDPVRNIYAHIPFLGKIFKLLK